MHVEQGIRYEVTKRNHNGEHRRASRFICIDCLESQQPIETQTIDDEMRLMIEEFGEVEAAIVLGIERGQSLACRYIPSSTPAHRMSIVTQEWVNHERVMSQGVAVPAPPSTPPSFDELCEVLSKDGLGARPPRPAFIKFMQTSEAPKEGDLDEELRDDMAKRLVLLFGGNYQAFYGFYRLDRLSESQVNELHPDKLQTYYEVLDSVVSTYGESKHKSRYDYNEEDVLAWLAEILTNLSEKTRFVEIAESV